MDEMLDENVMEIDVMLITGDILRYDQKLKTAFYDQESEMFKIIDAEGENFFPRESIATFFIKRKNNEEVGENDNTDNVISFRN